MSNPTSNYSFVMPTPTDLVTDLPADFEVFGQAVDTQMKTNADAATQKATLTTKGDLYAASAASTPARLAVGTNGQVLTADSTAATGLAWATPSGGSNTFYAGKNKIINGNFGIWQRGTSISLTNNTTAYTTDRWYVYTSFSAGSSTLSQQTFTPGAAPVSGYEGTNFARFTAGSTATYFEFGQRIEDVRVLAGQTATISFWAKASANTTVSSTLLQNFGSGGSSQVSVTGGSHSITTSWQRFNVSVSVPSISGKTVGTSSYLALTLAANSLTGSQTIDVWGTQLEAGSSATDFVTASGNSPQAELAMCQRYYYRLTATQAYSDFASGYNANASEASFMVPFPVSMRITPTAMEQTGTASNYNILHSSGGSPARAVCSTVPSYQVATPTNCRVYFIVSGGLTAGNGSIGGSNNNTSAYLGWSAEL